MRKSLDSSTQSGKILAGNKVKSGHPYLKPALWLDPSNHFWENKRFSEESKEYYRNWLLTL